MITHALALVVLLAQTPTATPPDRAAEIEKRLTEIRDEIARNSEKETALLEAIDGADETISEISAALRQIDERVAAAKKTMAEDEAAIAQLEDKIAKRKRWLSGRLRSLYVHGKPGYLKILFASESYADLLRRTKYQSIVSRHDAEMVTALKTDVAMIAERRANFGEELALYQQNQLEAQGMVEELEAQRAVRRGLLEDVQSERVDLGKMAQRLIAAARALDKTFSSLTPSTVFIPKPFANAKGKMLPPVTDAKIARAYGNYKHASGQELKHQGIKYAAEIGSPVHAIWDGKIEAARWLSSYGNIVIIDHGSGWRSLYAHVGRIDKGVGDFVKEGEVIALSGDTGSLEGPELFFAIYHEGKPEDPAPWLVTGK